MGGQQESGLIAFTSATAIVVFIFFVAVLVVALTRGAKPAPPTPSTTASTSTASTSTAKATSSSPSAAAPTLSWPTATAPAGWTQQMPSAPAPGGWPQQTAPAPSWTDWQAPTPGGQAWQQWQAPASGGQAWPGGGGFRHTGVLVGGAKPGETFAQDFACPQGVRCVAPPADGGEAGPVRPAAAGADGLPAFLRTGRGAKPGKPAADSHQAKKKRAPRHDAHAQEAPAPLAEPPKPQVKIAASAQDWSRAPGFGKENVVVPSEMFAGGRSSVPQGAAEFTESKPRALAADFARREEAPVRAAGKAPRKPAKEIRQTWMAEGGSGSDLSEGDIEWDAAEPEARTPVHHKPAPRAEFRPRLTGGSAAGQQEQQRSQAQPAPRPQAQQVPKPQPQQAPKPQAQQQHATQQQEGERRVQAPNPLVSAAPIDFGSGCTDSESGDGYSADSPRRVDFRSESTPSPEDGGRQVWVCSGPGAPIERGSAGVVDAVDFAGQRVELLAGGDLRVSPSGGGHARRVRSGLAVSSIEVFGHLYGVANGKLHVLEGGLEGAGAAWAPCAWAPSGLVAARATLDGSALWLQAAGRGFLFGSELELLADVPMKPGRERAYGATRGAYVEWGAGPAAFFPGGESAQGAEGAALGYHGEQYLSAERGRIKVLNWRPVFFAIGT